MPKVSARCTAGAVLLVLTAACGLQDREPAAPPDEARGERSQVASTPPAAAAATPAASEAPGPRRPGIALTPAAATPPARTAGAPPAASARPSPQDGSGTTTGIDPKSKTIRIAVHTRAAGASGARKYWQQSGPGGGPRLVNGFRIVLDVVDDGGNSRQAVRDCQSASQRALLLVSDADTDPLTACASSPVLRRSSTPYLSLGRTETGLSELPHYAALSGTYRQQSPWLVQMARDHGLLSRRWAVVVSDRADLAPVRESIVGELQRVKASGRDGAFSAERDVHQTSGTASDCVAVGGALRSGRYGTVYVLGLSPLLLAQCVGQHPTAVWTGPGPSYATQAVADLLCRSGGGGVQGYFLHPTPDLQTAQRRAEGAPALADEAEVAMWGAMQTLEQALLQPRGPLTREGFLAALRQGGTRGGLLPPTSYARRGPFGGTAAHGNRITCDGGRGGVVRTVGRYPT